MFNQDLSLFNKKKSFSFFTGYQSVSSLNIETRVTFSFTDMKMVILKKKFTKERGSNLAQKPKSQTFQNRPPVKLPM